jgi:hypothetical protein
MFQTLTDMSHRLSFPDREIPDSEAHSMESHVPGCYPFGSRCRDGTYYRDGTLERNNHVGCFKVSNAVDLALMLMMIRSGK